MKKKKPTPKRTASKRMTKKVMEERRIRRVEITVLVAFLLLLVTIFGEFGLTMIVGETFVFVFKYLFGLFRFPMYVILLYTLYHVFRYKKFFEPNIKFWGAILFLLTTMMMLGIPGYTMSQSVRDVFTIFKESLTFTGPISALEGGGVIGLFFYGLLKQYVGLVGVVIIGSLLLLGSSAMYLGKTVYEMVYPPIKATKNGIEKTTQRVASSLQERRERKFFDAEPFFDEDDVEEVDIFAVDALEFADADYYEYETPNTVFETYIDMDIPPYSEMDSIDEFALNQYDDELEVQKDGEMNTFGQTDTQELQPSQTISENYHEAEHTEQNQQTQVVKPSEPVKKPYRLPSINFLNKPQARSRQQAGTDRTEQKRVLQETLNNFGVNATVASVQVGPAVTQYEVTLAPGVKVNRIVNLSTDIALALAAKGVRIEAPIPGKAAVGIEVPNENIQMVGLYEVLRKGYEDKSKKLLVGLGRTISGEEVQIEINKMPHLLVAGATGSGKSVCINTIITSILLRATPDEVRFLMVDPKKVELNVYNDIPHLMAPVVTNPKKAAASLRTVVTEMEQRYELFADAFVRNMESYNEYAIKNSLTPLPYIVVIIDELSDLMVVAAKEVEESIMRLAQMARAAGIHMIVATQRPSVDVITGVIKSNIPSRIAFAVASQVDSRTILDSSGAEKLLGRGDMLYLSAGENKPQRVQGAYVSEEEIEKIVNFAKEQDTVSYDPRLLEVAEQTDDTLLFGDQNGEEEDELFEEAVQFAIASEMISTSKLQRRFRIGFNRASRIMDAMVERGLLGPVEGNKGRKVLIRNISELYEESTPELS